MGEPSGNQPQVNREPESDRIRYICDDASRQNGVIPVLPIFQADVPEWTNAAGRAIPDGYLTDAGTNKWLGTRTWPIENQLIEEGTVPNPKTKCRCRPRGSTRCVKRHVDDAILRKRVELGKAFDDWEFDSKGRSEDYFWSWTSADFRKLVKIPTSETSTFLTAAMEAVPSISRRGEIVSYYFNVLVPQRLAEQTRSGLSEIDSDDDVQMQLKQESLMHQVDS